MEKIFWGNNKSVEVLNLEKFQQFIDLPFSKKLDHLQREDGFPKPVVSSSQFNREFRIYIQTFKISQISS